MNRRMLTRVLGYGAAATLAVAAWAGPDKAQDNSSKNQDPLSGPKVESREVPGVDGQFGEGRRDKMRSGERVPTRMFMGAIRSLESPETPEDLRLTDEQRDEIRDIAEEFRGAMQAFRAEHRDELQALRDEAPGRGGQGARGRADRGQRQGDGPPPNARGQGGPNGRGPRGGDAPPPPPPGNGADEGAPPPRPSPEQRERMAEIMKDAPKAEPYHTRMWAVLSEAQQVVVRERLEKAMAEGPRGEGRRAQGGQDGARQRNPNGRGRGPGGGPPPSDKRQPPPSDL